MDKLLIFSIFIFLFTLIGTKYLKKILEYKKIFDIPNKRSSHIKPIPKGGGWIIVLSIIGIILLLDPYDKIPGIIAIAGLAFISWQDDLKNINVLVRLLFQIFFISIYFIFGHNISPIILSISGPTDNLIQVSLSSPGILTGVPVFLSPLLKLNPSFLNLLIVSLLSP